MIILQAPYPNLYHTTLLPNPQPSDTENDDLQIQVFQMMTGKTRIYVRGGSNRILAYTFLLTREKSLELRNFIEQFYYQPLKLTNHLNEVWVVNFTSNPFQTTVGHSDQIQLSFEGTKQ